MKIGPNFASFNMSAKGMSIQKKKMDLVAENIANANTTKTANGDPYKRKFMVVEEGASSVAQKINNPFQQTSTNNDIVTNVKKDKSVGELVFMPDHPDANEDGYVQMPNVDIVTEMIDMITATRTFEANLTAFNASKQIAKDSLEI